MSFTNYLESKVLDYIFGGVSFSFPIIEVALYTSSPGEVSSGVEVSFSGTGYARVDTTSSDWTNASSGLLSNATVITFPTAITDWGNITHFSLIAAGFILMYGPIVGGPIPITLGSIPRFTIGTLIIQVD